MNFPEATLATTSMLQDYSVEPTTLMLSTALFDQYDDPDFSAHSSAANDDDYEYENLYPSMG